MFTDKNGVVIENAQSVTAEEFWKHVFNYDVMQVQKDALSLVSTLDEIIMDRIGENMEITTGVVLSYNKKTRMAVVNLVTNIDYQVNAILQKDNTSSLQRESTLTQETLSIYNFSIFNNLEVGTPVIIIKPQGGYQINYFIIGVLHPQNQKSLFDEYELLAKKSAEQEKRIIILENKIKSLETLIDSL